MKFRPETLVYRVILKPHIEKETKSGIVIARDERSQAINTDKGTVVFVGPKAECDVKPGDKVYYAKYGAKVLKDEINSDFYIICNDEDILVGYEDEELYSIEEKNIVEKIDINDKRQFMVTKVGYSDE